MNAEPLVVTTDAVEPEIPNPVEALTAAYLTASGLDVAGATDEIRYAAKKATRTIGYLLREMERHRRVVGEPRT